jgi:hypothetical protein
MQRETNVLKVIVPNPKLWGERDLRVIKINRLGCCCEGSLDASTDATCGSASSAAGASAEANLLG